MNNPFREMRHLSKILRQTENYRIPVPPKQIGPKKKQLTEILAFIKRKQNKIWIFFLPRSARTIKNRCRTKKNQSKKNIFIWNLRQKQKLKSTTAAATTKNKNPNFFGCTSRSNPSQTFDAVISNHLAGFKEELISVRFAKMLWPFVFTKKRVLIST